MRRRLSLALACLTLAPGAPFGATAPAAKPPQTMTVVATAYCLGPCRVCGTRGRTALGSRGGRGAAVGRRRRVVPLGSRLRVPGYGSARVDDVGGGVRGDQIDLRFRSHAQAKRWGKRRLRIQVIRKK